MSQFIAVQALFNIVHGERYKVVPDEIKNHALGWYGQPVAPLDPEVMDRITGGAAPIEERPGALLKPRVDACRAALGANASDEEVILALHYKKKQLDAWRHLLNRSANAVVMDSPITTLVKALTERPQVTYAYVEKGEFKFEFASKEAQ